MDNFETSVEEQVVSEVVAKEEKSDGWVLLDLSDIIIHLFTEEQRHLYKFEEIWK